MQDNAIRDYPFIPFTHHLIFRRVMRDPVTAKEFLERILRINIDRIEYCNTEQTLDFDLEAKGVRLDLYVKGDDRVFNVEMQTQDYSGLGKRMAYYQAAINSGAVERGKRDYNLPEVFLIFLCADDPFGHGCSRYTFKTACEEVDGLALETGSHWIVLNAADYAAEQDKDVRALLKYVATQETVPHDSLVSRIDEEVRALNHDEELVAMASMFLTYEEDAIARGMLRGHREGLAEGETLGEDRYAALAGVLAKAGRVEDIERAATDKVFRKQLLEEFGF